MRCRVFLWYMRKVSRFRKKSDEQPAHDSSCNSRLLKAPPKQKGPTEIAEPFCFILTLRSQRSGINVILQPLHMLPGRLHPPHRHLTLLFGFFYLSFFLDRWLFIKSSALELFKQTFFIELTLQTFQGSFDLILINGDLQIRHSCFQGYEVLVYTCFFYRFSSGLPVLLFLLTRDGYFSCFIVRIFSYFLP
jgi:hypothetical protein